MLSNFYKTHKTLIRQIVLYGIIGLTSATLDSVLFILFRHLGINLFLANFISINCGITLSFLLNTFINFKVKTNIVKRAVSFFGVGYIGLLLSMAIMFVFVTKLGYPEIIVKIISVFFVAAVQFCLNKFITFGKRL